MAQLDPIRRPATTLGLLACGPVQQTESRPAC
jgi:hypothetical protein